MERTQEVLDFEAQYEPEIVEILAVTEAGTVGGSKSGNDQYWTACIYLIAWKRVDTPEVLHRERILLRQVVDDEGLEVMKEEIKPDSLYCFRVRKDENSFMLVEIVAEGADDEELQQLLEKEKAGVIHEDALLGTLVLDRVDCYFKGKINWMGQELDFDINVEDPDIPFEELLKTAHAVYTDQEKWDKKLKEYAAEKLLQLKNECWLDEYEDGTVEDPLTMEDFMTRIQPTSLSILPEGKFNMNYDDDDIFWGHAIAVDATLEEGGTFAEFYG